MIRDILSIPLFLILFVVAMVYGGIEWVAESIMNLFKIWCKALNKATSEVMEMEEPNRSWLLDQIFNGGKHE